MISEDTAFMYAVIFGIIAALLIRSRNVRAWEAACIGLFGLYLGHTPVFFTVHDLFTWFLNGFSHT
ncbi:hypothetical protein DF268_15305 [Streptomyces sp. V2]|uniref:hypothetical protein n=1 Tax=Streptomyces TaxID=1883 RepID=UPI0006EBBE65|nr:MULTISPECIES: hypothetical protein [Streptomyces]PWG12651.1 hypothetical protein DF268_15305 [Streptomyces sp. V2]